MGVTVQNTKKYPSSPAREVHAYVTRWKNIKETGIGTKLNVTIDLVVYTRTRKMSLTKI